MAEPDISPLAKSLAEQNEVDWRRLLGSGPGGRITERDVFAYLASAEVAPAPAPQGHELWHGEDAEAAQPEAAGALPDFDEALLLTDDPLEEGRDDPHPYELALGAQGWTDEDALELDFEIESNDVLERPDPEARPADPSSADLLFETPPEPTGQESALRLEKGYDAPAFDDLDFHDPRLGDRAVDDRDADDHDVDDRDADNRDADGQDADDQDADAPDAGDAGRGDTPGTGLGGDDLDLLEDEDQDDTARRYDETRLDLADATGGSSPGPADLYGDRHDESAALGPWAEPEAAPEVAAARADEEGEEPQPGLGKLPLVSHGLLLRSRIDLTPVAEAQAAVGRALGRDDRLAPTAFLVRAAARALRSREDARVALAVLSYEGLGAAAIDGAARMSFAELLETVTELAASGRTGRDEADLMVADLSAYAVDEAVLHVGMPVLALGCVQAGSDGPAYTTLSLSGDLDDLGPVRAADLLGRVAALLASPVELIL